MPLIDVKKVADADFPTRWGHFRILGFEGTRIDPEPCAPGTAVVHKKIEGAVALVLGDIHNGPPVVRTLAIRRGFQSDRQPDHIVAGPRRETLLVRQLTMRG